jgi:plastocyanin
MKGNLNFCQLVYVNTIGIAFIFLFLVSIYILVQVNQTYGVDSIVEVRIPPGSSAPVDNPSFDPHNLTIQEGTTVIWTNDDETLHTVTSGSPEGGESATVFDSGYLTGGKKFEWKFDKEGNFAYYCTLHPFLRGIISVVGEKFSMEVILKEKLDEYSDKIKFEPEFVNMSQNSKFCQSGKCNYEVSDGQLDPNNTFDSTLRVFEGMLKVITEQGDTKVTRLLPFESYLTVTEIRETGNKSIELMDGTISFGKNIINPDFKYSISNGTLTIVGRNATLNLSSSNLQ